MGVFLIASSPSTMAYHGPSYGLDAELKAKQSSKYDPAIEASVLQYIQSMTGESISAGQDNLHAALKDGITLCNLANKLSPGIIPRIQKGKMPFVQMENINSFLMACKRIGVPDTDLFMTVDLFEAKNMSQVLQTLHTLQMLKGGH